MRSGSVTATGRFLADKQVLARLRVVEATRVPGAGAVRGRGRPDRARRPRMRPARRWFARSADRRTADRDRDAGGPAARFRDRPADKQPVTEQGFRQVYAIDTGRFRSWSGFPLTGSYVQLGADQPGGLGVAPLPHLDAGPFLSYGIQWIAFGIVAPIGLVTSCTPS